MSEYAGIHLLDNPYFIDNAYDYYIPPVFRGKIATGDFVSVPFGTANKRRVGLVCSLKDAPDNKKTECKPIAGILDKSASLSSEMLGLSFFIKEQTLCTVGDAVRAMIPSSLLSSPEEFYTVSDVLCVNSEISDRELLIYSEIMEKKKISFSSLKRSYNEQIIPALKHLEDLGLIEKTYELKRPSEKFTTLIYPAKAKEMLSQLSENASGTSKLRSAAHLRIVEYMASNYELAMEGIEDNTVCEACQVTKAQIKALEDKEFLRSEKRSADRSLSLIENIETARREITLSEEQRDAYEQLKKLFYADEAKAALLHGVTGSGKTSVMIKTIDMALDEGKGVIMLLPEIALTPQSLSIFCSRYGKLVSIIHSGLSAGERYDSFKRIKSGEARIVIGTRSAIFAPVSDLGLVIIDEEHEHTYKSDMNPKYHARDIARYRCAHHGALMLLASATPSFESYYKAINGKYTLIKLQNRYGGAKLPETLICDMREETKKGCTSPLSSLLCEELVKKKQKGEQSILFINRRGYNSFVSCPMCGEAIRCPECSVSMTYHTTSRAYDKGELRCHWCGRRAALPAECPSCKGTHLTRMGFGTQRIEQELSELVPDGKILRMDTDTTAAKNAYDVMLGRFRRHEADILLGTQMVTKGHDFPDVTLVGVLLADMSLYLDDYRANERTFSMLTQVIGRAGRGNKEGIAIIQTNNPDSDCIRLACRQDYEAFFKDEIRLRKALCFPPFCDIALLTLTSSDEKELLKASGILSDMLSEKMLDIEYKELPMIVFGPFEAPVYKVDNKYRMRMVIKCKLNKKCRSLFSGLLSEFSRKTPNKISLSIDFNPSNL